MTTEEQVNMTAADLSKARPRAGRAPPRPAHASRRRADMSDDSQHHHLGARLLLLV